MLGKEVQMNKAKAEQTRRGGVRTRSSPESILQQLRSAKEKAENIIIIIPFQEEVIIDAESKTAGK